MVPIIFCCSCAQENKDLLNEFQIQVKALLRQESFSINYDQDILAGDTKKTYLKQQIDAADVILLLLSPCFMSCDDCYNIKLKYVLGRKNKARIIPILLYDVYWQGLLGELQPLPMNHRPVTDPEWSSLQKAFFDVVEGIRQVINRQKTYSFFTSSYSSPKIEQETLPLENFSQKAHKLLQTTEVEPLITFTFSFQGHTDTISSIAFSPNGKFIVSTSNDQTIRLWEIATEDILFTFEESASRAIFSTDEQLLISGNENGTIKIWDLKEKKLQNTIIAHNEWISSLSLSANGKFLVSSSDDQTIKLWEIPTGRSVRKLMGHKNWVCSAIYSPDGLWLASSSTDQTVKLWNSVTGNIIHTYKKHEKAVYCVAFSPNSRILASGSADKTIILWNLVQKKCVKVLEGHTGEIYSVAFHSDGQILASGSNDQTIKLWSLTTGKTLQTLTEHTGRVYSIAFSPNGQWLASGGEDQIIRIWKVSYMHGIET